MNGLNLQGEIAQRKWKDGYKVNVFCIVDQDHQRQLVNDKPTTYGLRYQKWSNTLSPIWGKRKS